MSSEFLRVGRHLLRVEGDVVFVIWNGDVGLEDVRELFDAVDRACAGQPMLFMLSDSRSTGSFDPEARRWVMQQSRGRRQIALSVVFGASFPVRVVGNMIHRAMRLFVPDAPEIVFFGTEAEARAFIDEERRRRHAAA